MAAVAVTADNTRVDDAEAGTGYSNIGGGAGGAAEAPFAYQGSNLFNRKVTSATGAGFFYDPTTDSGSAQDMTATGRRHWMVKIMVSDYGGLDTTDGVRVRIGSDGSNYDTYVLAGSDSPVAVMATYRPVGGLLVFPVSANEATAYSDSGKSTGTPTLTAVDYFGAVYAFASSTAKNENCGLDAIDIGSGLFLVGGDGGDTDGVYQDFVDEDEGTVANRWGYARAADGGGLLAFGDWRIGENSGGAVATEFNDNQAVITWLDGMFEAGFSRVTVNLGNASTDVTDGCLHIGTGTTTNVDTRPDYVFEGTSGTGLFNGTLRNFRNFTLTSAAALSGDIECLLLTQASGTITGATIRTNQITSVACLQDPSFADIDDVEFIQSGVGHAIEIDTAGTYTFDNLRFTGYGANASADAAIDVTETTGTVTINIINGGDTPTYISAGATVVINNTVTVSVTALDANDSSAISGARVLLLAATGGPLPFEDSVSITRSGSTASVSHTSHGLNDGDKVWIAGADQQEYNGVKTITNVTTNAYDFTVSGTPTTPATGTITATAVVLDGTTNGSGVIQDTGFNFISNQPVEGRARKSTSSPFYKTSPISGTITSAGFSANAFMVLDE